MVNDTVLSYGVIAIECLILGVLVSLCVRSSALRKRAIVVLGSVTPMLLFYVSAWIEFERDPTDPSARFSFYAMWIMCFGFFLISAALGSVVALLPRPNQIWARYLLGVLVGLALFAAVTKYV